MKNIRKFIENEKLPTSIRNEIQKFYLRFFSARINERGWDGKNAKAIKAKTMFNAFEMTQNIFEWIKCHANIEIPSPEIQARPGGTIYLSWKKDENNCLQMAIKTSPLRKGVHYSMIRMKSKKNKNGFEEKILHSKPVSEYKQLELINFFK